VVDGFGGEERSCGVAVKSVLISRDGTGNEKQVPHEIEQVGSRRSRAYIYGSKFFFCSVYFQCYIETDGEIVEMLT
jgi:hypothetical protein